MYSHELFLPYSKLATEWIFQLYFVVGTVIVTTHFIISIIKKVGNARLEENDFHPQPHNTNIQTERRGRENMLVEDKNETLKTRSSHTVEYMHSQQDHTTEKKKDFF